MTTLSLQGTIKNDGFFIDWSVKRKYNGNFVRQWSRQSVEKKEEAGRLQHRVRALKGSLTHDVTSCIDRIKHFKTKYPTDDDMETSSMKIDYAKDILASLDRTHD